jgi:hypothetical protein
VADCLLPVRPAKLHFPSRAGAGLSDAGQYEPEDQRSTGISDGNGPGRRVYHSPYGAGHLSIRIALDLLALEAEAIAGADIRGRAAGESRPNRCDP